LSGGDGTENPWTSGTGPGGRRRTERDAEEVGLWAYVPFPLLEELVGEAAELSHLVSGPSAVSIKES